MTSVDTDFIKKTVFIKALPVSTAGQNEVATPHECWMNTLQIATSVEILETIFEC